MHLEYIHVYTIANPLSDTPSISEDIAALCPRVPKGLVENRNISEVVSGSIFWHAPSLHIQDHTAEVSKQMVKNFMRYSSSKIRKNVSNENHMIAKSREKNNNMGQGLSC